MRIAVDIDCTLHPFYEDLIEALASVGVEADYRSLLFYDSWLEGLTNAQIKAVADVYHAPERILRAQPYPGAQAVLNSWVRDGHEIVIVSARSSALTDVTAKWLASERLPYHELICRPTHNKVESLPDDVGLVVDDHPNTMVQALMSGRAAAGIAHPWNSNFQAVHAAVIADSWDDLRTQIAERGVL